MDGVAGEELFYYSVQEFFRIIFLVRMDLFQKKSAGRFVRKYCQTVVPEIKDTFFTGCKILKNGRSAQKEELTQL